MAPPHPGERNEKKLLFAAWGRPERGSAWRLPLRLGRRQWALRELPLLLRTKGTLGNELHTTHVFIARQQRELGKWI